MQSGDEQAIRGLVEEWLAAIARGTLEAVLDLMTDDALFLVPGQPPMDKAAFATASRSGAGAKHVIEGISDIKEVHVDGETAYMWSHLTVIATVPGGAPPVRREGHTLTIFRKVKGKWLLARDANLLVQM